MSSPGTVSSPVSISPTRRRSLSPSEISDRTSIRPARHSPTLTRSFDPNDPQVRERQRTMDVDMAMQLSLARRETLHSSPVATFSSPGTLSGQQQPLSDHSFPPLGSPGEEGREMTDDIVGEDTVFENATDGDRAISSIHESQTLHRSDPSLPLHPTEDPQSSNFGLPTYQANVSQSAFDFAPMEEWAAAEKTRLGFTSPLNTRFQINPVRGRSKPDNDIKSPPAFSPDAQTHEVSKLSGSMNEAAVASGSSLAPLQTDSIPAAAFEETHSDRPLRHRKLSQSNPHPRSHRKGIGGKMALFESAPTDAPSFSARLGLVLGHQGGPITSGPSDDHIAGVPRTGPAGGILNTGHDRPYRFSFYSNAISATIHARSLSELPAEGQTFEQLFSGSPAPPNETSMGHASSVEGTAGKDRGAAFSPPHSDNVKQMTPGEGVGYFPPRDNGYNGHKRTGEKVGAGGGGGGGMNTLSDDQDGNTWWLDVQSPTDEEMKMLSKVFSIHPLTTEDILMEETREKIELFRNYYLVCFRSFDQDPYSPTHLEPLNMYIIVFRQGILSFHFRPTPHPQNVRRRIKQLKDYISVTSDWISYALIDDITDAFGPLIQGIEYEVDSIDELVLILKEAEQSDMLRRIGTCRKKVMGLLRLMGNKADVVKGLAKRCNENWRVAPTSDIGLYLSDIQDHLITMTQNLNHYEKILSRSHSNYLAQISIEMTDANNQINDVLSKLTALGTVLIPMNLVTGLWGMNVHVPGQDVPGYAWFISIIACLAAFALIGGYSTYRFMVRR
ncbi:Putative metal ion transporter C17A12.14 [Psilocybe cubensis]|uniref:Metal ion transporter C17A12.14 n=2 Tax=Psilocybe cubensis TaxID=181762 RepID=A0ACB8H594_PSICU|nr:Putative metal ion transporter C17A12.14 [Psilocybe cubensis]KAH9482360.1 Putative metal ion transporter C17A12.14 [Psilocybe cubensis]